MSFRDDAMDYRPYDDRYLDGYDDEDEDEDEDMDEDECGEDTTSWGDFVLGVGVGIMLGVLLCLILQSAFPAPGNQPPPVEVINGE